MLTSRPTAVDAAAGAAATRYDKAAMSYQATVTIAALLQWL